MKVFGRWMNYLSTLRHFLKNLNKQAKSLKPPRKMRTGALGIVATSFLKP